MSTWLIFTLLAPMMWATAMVFDGACRRHLIKDDHTLTWLMSVLRLPFVIFLLIIADFSSISTVGIIFMLIAGMLWTWPIQFYSQALETEEVSSISIFMQTIPIFTLLIAYIWIGEELHTNQFIAFLFLMLAGVIASFKGEEMKWKFSKGMLLMTIAAFLWALSDVMFKKFESTFTDYWTAFSIYFLGSFLVSILFMGERKKRNKIIKNVKKIGLKAWVLVFISIALGIGGTISFTYALTIGKASLTSVFLGIEPIMIIAVSYILYRFIKEVDKEKLDKKNALIKAGAIFLIFVGLFFLNF